MELIVDLHSHSGHAGGVGNVSPAAVAGTMARKGIQVFGTGDCLQPDWYQSLQSMLVEKESGLFALAEADGSTAEARFVLQTEIIITADVPSGGRKGTHVVLLFPGFAAAAEVAAILKGRASKLNMGRPFVKCGDSSDVSALLYEICAVDPHIVIVPAHVLTPQGIYGSDHPVTFMTEFFGDFADEIYVVETGLSADPEILGLIPELDKRALISNSDCHSAALNRVGREFTALDVKERSFPAIVEALRKRSILYTAEFSPAEGRFFLTGLRAGKQGLGPDQFCYFSPDTVPEDGRCPISGKPLTVGVLQRALQLGALQGEPRSLESVTPTQDCIHMVPLVEVIACALGVKSASSRKVLAVFDAILDRCETESSVWKFSDKELESRLRGVLLPEVLETLVQVRRGDFTFEPLGYDGTYGTLAVGSRGEWFGHAVVHR